MPELPLEFIPFRFKVSLFGKDQKDLVCSGAFSEVSGLDATMSPLKFKEGGRNWGEVQLAGTTTFSTIVLKRGMTEINDSWVWFEYVTRKANYGYRLSGQIDVKDWAGNIQMSWKLNNVMPIKFKGADLSSTASQVAIEELQLVHEGLRLERPAPEK